MSFCGTHEQCMFIVDLSTIVGRTKKKKKRERKTQNTKRKCQINLNPNGYWVLASAPVKPHPLPTPHSSRENIIIKQERKECYKKKKRELHCSSVGKSTKHMGKLGNRIYYTMHFERNENYKLFHYLAYFYYYLWDSLHFLILVIGSLYYFN